MDDLLVGMYVILMNFAKGRRLVPYLMHCNF